MQELSHKCIKPTCENIYNDTDVEAYYCPSCRELNKVIAQQIDAKLSKEPKPRSKSELEQYEELRKAKGVRFVNIRDLGITL